MQTGYFSAAWNDVKSSQGWLGKMFLLGLIAFIPVFGPVVLLGYAFGWARDIAWGVHMPMPARIFGNEDGLLYRRGLIVFCLALAVVVSAASAFAVVMQARAVGYWTRQFDVPAWRGQDDPMPFEMASSGAPR